MTVTLQTTTSGVVGPASATNNALPRFDATTGKKLQGSGIIVDDSDNMTGIAGITASGDIFGAIGHCIPGRSAVGPITGRYLQPYGTGGDLIPVTLNRDLVWSSLIFCSERTTWTKIGISITTAVASMTVRLGIYKDDGGPGTLSFDAGTIDASTTGEKEITISEELKAGMYWVAALPEGGATDIAVDFKSVFGASGFLGQNTLASEPGIFFGTDTGALADPFVKAGEADLSAAPLIWLKK